MIYDRTKRPEGWLLLSLLREKLLTLWAGSRGKGKDQAWTRGTKDHLSVSNMI